MQIDKGIAIAIERMRRPSGKADQLSFLQVLDVSLVAELAHVGLGLPGGLSSNIVPHELPQLLDLQLVNPVLLLLLLQNQELLLFLQLLLLVIQVDRSDLLLPGPLHLLLLLLNALNLRLQVPQHLYCNIGKRLLAPEFLLII